MGRLVRRVGMELRLIQSASAHGMGTSAVLAN